MAKTGNPTAFLREAVQSYGGYPASFDAAMRQIKAMQKQELATPGFNPATPTIALTHGKKTRRAVVWFHGYTAVPNQFQRLAELCYERGINAFVPCIPHHGFLDRLSDETCKMKGPELIHFTERMVDLAHGLGEEVIVGGLSMGGVMAAWAAQQRADVRLALVIAPFLGARIIPPAWTKTAAFGLRLLPDRKEWWNAQTRDQEPDTPYGYLQRSNRSLGEILGVSQQIFAQARRHPPAAGTVWMIINDADESVNNIVNRQLLALWQKTRPAAVHSYYFPAELGLPHDCISVEQPKGHTEIVYPEIMKRIG